MITTFNSDNLRDRRPAEDAIIEMHIAINAKVKEYSTGVKPYTFWKTNGEAAKYEKKPPITKDKEKTVNINFRFKRSVFILKIETKAFFSLLSTANDSGTWN